MANSNNNSGPGDRTIKILFKPKPGQQFDKQRNHLRATAKNKKIEVSVAELDDFDALKIKVDAADAAFRTEEKRSTIPNANKFKANITQEQYDQYMKAYNERAKLVAVWNRKLAIKEKLRWSALIVNRRFKEVNRKSFNESYGLGNIKHSFDFPDFLMGGGPVWIEPFLEDVGAKFIQPYGGFVSGKLDTPNVINALWKDGNNKTIANGSKVAPGSTLYLHIYTQDLYGHQIDVSFFDNNYFGDDQLNPYPRTNGAPDNYDPEKQILPTQPANPNFRTEVKAYPFKDDLPDSIQGTLVKDDDNQTDGIISQDKYVQKAIVKVYIDPLWFIEGNDGKAVQKGDEIELEIYPTVNADELKEPQELTAVNIIVVSTAPVIDSELTPQGNKPIFVNDIETNVSNFDPCQYTKLKLINNSEPDDKKKETVLYEEGVAEKEDPNTVVGLFVGNKHKNFSFVTDEDADTSECNLAQASRHKSIFAITNEKQLPYNISVKKKESKAIDIDTYFNYDNNFIAYIWPQLWVSDSSSRIQINAATCRHFNYIEAIVCPDIKWTLKFFLNLTNDLSVSWTNLDEHEHKEMQKKAGKIGAEKRWQQKDASFGFSLKAEWNKEGYNYADENEFKLQYETKFKKIYDVFASIGALSDGIMNKTKGTVRGISPTGLPLTFAVKPPNIELSGIWFLANAKNELDRYDIGTDLDLSLKANPLIGLEMTIDLLGAIVFGASGLISGGTASVGALRLYDQIQTRLKMGIDLGDDDVGFKANVDIYMDLIISGLIESDVQFKCNTAGKLSDSQLKLESSFKLKVELKVGVKIKGEVALVVCKVIGYFEASAEADASITFGSKLVYDKEGLYYQPILGFDGLNAKYIVYISIGLAKKISRKKLTAEDKKEDKYIIAEGHYDDVIPPFDVMEHCAQLFGVEPKIPIIKN